MTYKTYRLLFLSLYNRSVNPPSSRKALSSWRSCWSKR